MPHGTRRFAKNSGDVRHFRLVARSGFDKEGENPDATPLVLEPIVHPHEKKAAAKKGINPDDLLQIPESLQVLGPEVFGLDSRPAGIEFSSDEEEYNEDEDELAELDDDCYFPKDGYNYNKHLKTLSTEKKKVGGVVLEPPEKLDVKVDQKAIMVQQPTTHEEEELMAALDDADIYEDMDEDMIDGIIPNGGFADEVILWGEQAAEDMNLPDLAVFKAMHAQRMAAEQGEEDDDEPYIEEREGGPRNAGEPVDDSQFDQLLEDEYGEEADGALSDDEIEGPDDIEKMDSVLDGYLADQAADKLKWDNLVEPQEQKLCDCPRSIVETKALIEKHYAFVAEEGDEDTSEGETNEDESKNWDAETILSTLSNVSNRPGKLIKVKIPKRVVAAKDLPAIVEAEDKSDSESDDAVDLPDVVLDRPTKLMGGETPEEKKLRKNGVKEMRRICRKMKKESKDMYKNEAKKLDIVRGGCDVRQGLRLNKL